jgi:RNA polymerase sigma factor (sigma-70 family)
LVLLSAQSRVPGYQVALGELYRIYWYPLYAFVRRRGHTPEEAQDLTQGFFLHLLEHKTLGRADPEKGKFRSFLLGSLQKFLSTEGARARCLKRGGNVEFVPLEMQAAEDRYRLEPTDYLTAERIFDARCAITLLTEALNRLRQLYVAEGKTSTFEALEVFLDPVNSRASLSCEEAANRLQVTTGGVKTLIHRLRKRYTALLREEIGRTVSEPAEIDEEIHALCEALIATEGRLGP